MSEPRGAQSVERALTLLGIITASHHDFRPNLAQLCVETGLNRTTAFRLLNVLESYGYVSRDEVGRYHPGAAAIALGDGDDKMLRQIAQPVLLRLAKETGCIAQAESSHPVRVAYSVGSESPLHAGCSGRVLLTFSNDGFIEQYLHDSPLDAITTDTLTNAESIRSEIARARSAGFVVSHGEREPHVSGVGVPIWAGPGVLRCGLTVLWPDQRNVAGLEKKVLSAAMSAAREISHGLGASIADSDIKNKVTASAREAAND
jgi:DNA-binding IclR family transcriptional regulator